MHRSCPVAGRPAASRGRVHVHRYWNWPDGINHCPFYGLQRFLSGAHCMKYHRAPSFHAGDEDGRLTGICKGVKWKHAHDFDFAFSLSVRGTARSAAGFAFGPGASTTKLSNSISGAAFITGSFGKRSEGSYQGGFSIAPPSSACAINCPI